MNAWFDRFARKNNIAIAELLAVINRTEKGLIDASLGGHIIKQRIARPQQGRSKGYRSIIVYQQSTKAFFVYGFAKGDKDNITASEEAVFKTMAPYLLSLSATQLQQLIKQGDFKEIGHEG